MLLTSNLTHMLSCYVRVTERSMGNCMCDKMADLTAECSNFITKQL